MREPVAVSDDELVERELRVAEGSGPLARRGRRRARSGFAQRRAGTSWCAPRDALRCEAGTAARFAQRLLLWLLGDEINGECDARHPRHRVLEQPPEAIAHPAQRVRLAGEHERARGQLHRAQRGEPEAVGGLADRERELALDEWPYVLELLAHGGVVRLPLLAEARRNSSGGGPSRARCGEYIPRPSGALGPCSQLAGKTLVASRSHRGPILSARSPPLGGGTILPEHPP